MGSLRIAAAAVFATVALALVPGSAPAVKLVPPGNSAANQYTEVYPTTGGGAPAGDKGNRSPGKVLGKRNARRLEALGPEGRAAAALAAATAPSRSVTGNRAVAGGGAHSNQGEPSGSSGLGEVIAQVTGSSSSGGMGLLLPLVIAAAVIGSLAYLWRWKRRTA